MVTLPRVLVAAPASGHGKTTVATGLMAALAARGHVVSGHKVGPDYIDPGYHALATGRPGRNLDPHLTDPALMVPLLLHGAQGADVAVVEGVMGLFDGQIGGDGFASSAHVATLTRTPVVLVVDVSHASRSVGAVVHGMATFEPGVTVAGVILNKAGSPRHAAEARAAVERTGVPVLGVLQRDHGVSAPSRHLGLVPAEERDEAAGSLDRLAAQVAEHVDLDAVLEIARSAAPLDEPAWDPADHVRPAGPDAPVVAVAAGRAFTFRYAETTELLEAAGCTVVPFDPARDRHLPAGTRGLYLGGGFPEVHAAALSANTSLRADLRQAVLDGVPTVAECAGLLYLCRTVDGHPMIGALDADAVMTPRLTLSYRTPRLGTDQLLGPAGTTATAHEFHRTTVTPVHGDRPAWSLDAGDVGFAGPTLSASYLHLHWAGHPHLAQSFADAVHGSTATARPAAPVAATSSPVTGSTTLADPLRHHGDVEATEGLLDLAVNVSRLPRPEWLEQALRDGTAASTAYPDASAAHAAVARRHGRDADEVLVTAGAAEAFFLLARARHWRRPVVVHPQFTEPDVALRAAGHRPAHVLCHAEDDFALDPALVPDDADLVVVGNPTNPTGRLHPAATLRALCRPGRVVVVDEAFMDHVPGERQTLTAHRLPGLVVVRSLTKLWSMPGVRAGYVVGDPAVVADLRAQQPPWSVGTAALHAVVATSGPQALAESDHRARLSVRHRKVLVDGLAELGVEVVPSEAPFVLARLGSGGHARLRAAGVAVRRADTFPGLDDTWARLAVREPAATRHLLTTLGVEAAWS
ncbi:cobyrinate a,c-diamide synthase [Aeromicrobium massiliense]|uniref:cobyrinate a,c-diamide synthase n=1 Tax=Aeromicrobium massiliense TaxID=1464554 RepID=UPI000577F9F3|nr:cobyrinate a,c-diamide synthase [Aeromicrobium massiliense]